ncbi:hypothetical protein TSUD_232430 [Trifolium subterraneum]|uniref:Uncharacterized protein n=1 Tax=Trifolium subterraneum TaxID=3900 RepID=A0A2Z6LN67_TRISU|nr:hypothetical protein TSUD_232430 [Trifolium subterraneum]
MANIIKASSIIRDNEGARKNTKVESTNQQELKYPGELKNSPPKPNQLPTEAASKPPHLYQNQKLHVATTKHKNCRLTAK